MKDAAMVNPSAYLTKPVNPSSLFIAIQSAINNFSNNRAPASTSKEEAFSSFFVKQGTRYKKIDWKDVAYMSAGKNYISVFNTADKTEYFIRSSIQKALQHLIPKQMQQQFVQINRAEVVQFSYITEVANDEVKTAHKSFVVSDTFMKDFRNRMNII